MSFGKSRLPSGPGGLLGRELGPGSNDVIAPSREADTSSVEHLLEEVRCDWDD